MVLEINTLFKIRLCPGLKQHPRQQVQSALISEQKTGGKIQGSSSLSILNIPPTHLPTPQCECEAITAPSMVMAAGVKGDTSDSISPTGNAKVSQSAI